MKADGLEIMNYCIKINVIQSNSSNELSCMLFGHLILTIFSQPTH